MTTLTHNIQLKLLSLALAAMMWFIVIWERTDERDFTARVVYTLPAGFVIKGPSPQTVRVRISGPRVMLLKITARPLEARLDLTGVEPGRIAFGNLGRLVALPRDLHVVRMQPETIELEVVKKQ